MAHPDHAQFQAINQIAESLSSEERRSLSYLCGSVDSDCSVARVKELLRTKVMRHERGQLLLRELMMQLRRFDILRKVCKSSREEVERTLIHRQLLPQYRVLMTDISEEMGSEDVNNVKFLLGNTLTREKMENSKSFLDVIIELEKQDKASSKRLELVEDCLESIGRKDLAKKVTAYKVSGATSEQQSSQQQRCRAPFPFPAANSSYPQPTRVQLLCSAAEKIPERLYREQNSQSQLDRYKFNSNPRGVCVIIDCVGNDGDMLKETFGALHFKVILHKWLNADDTLSALRMIARQRENLEGDGFVCCIISRGTEQRLLGTDTVTTLGLSLDTVRHQFTSDVCPFLAGKPKLFFIQRYSLTEVQPCARMQHRDEDLETDGCDGLSGCAFIPTDADVFWSHCWTDERQLELGNHRSVYLKTLADALHKGQRRKRPLVEVHTEVNAGIFEHNRWNPGSVYNIDLKHTLRKDLFLQ